MLAVGIALALNIIPVNIECFIFIYYLNAITSYIEF